MKVFKAFFLLMSGVSVGLAMQRSENVIRESCERVPNACFSGPVSCERRGRCYEATVYKLSYKEKECNRGCGSVQVRLAESLDKNTVYVYINYFFVPKSELVAAVAADVYQFIQSLWRGRTVRIKHDRFGASVLEVELPKLGMLIACEDAPNRYTGFQGVDTK